MEETLENTNDIMAGKQQSYALDSNMETPADKRGFIENSVDGPSSPPYYESKSYALLTSPVSPDM